MWNRPFIIHNNNNNVKSSLVLHRCQVDWHPADVLNYSTH